MRHKILILLIFSLCVACEPDGGLQQSEPVLTDESVGLPTVADLLGSYTVQTEESGECLVNPKTSPSIITGIGPGQLRLLNFFNYGTSTRNISVQYLDGEINFAIQKSGIDIDCNGRGIRNGLTVTLHFQCQVIEPANAAGSCAATFVSK